MIFISYTLYLYLSHDKGDVHLIWYGEYFSACSHLYHRECGPDFQGVSGWMELTVELSHSAHHLGKESHVPYPTSVHVMSHTEILCFCLYSAPASRTSISSKKTPNQAFIAAVNLSPTLNCQLYYLPTWFSFPLVIQMSYC